MATSSKSKSDTNTLGAATEDRVTITGNHTYIEVVNLDTAALIYCLIGNASVGAATVAGDNCEVVLPGERLPLLNQWGGAATVSLISAGTPAYQVVGR